MEVKACRSRQFGESSLVSEVPGANGMQGNVEQGYLELGVREKQRGGSEEMSGGEASHGPWGALRRDGDFTWCQG